MYKGYRIVPHHRGGYALLLPYVGMVTMRGRPTRYSAPGPRAVKQFKTRQAAKDHVDLIEADKV